MIRKWGIGNFKSFRKYSEIELAPLTILAGSNSSGKSTFLQSILLIKQTLQYAPSRRPIALNGPLVQLGYLEDVLHHKSTSTRRGKKDGEMVVGWELELEDPFHHAFLSHNSARVRSRPRPAEKLLAKGRLHVDASGVNRDKELLQLEPRLKKLVWELSNPPAPGKSKGKRRLRLDIRRNRYRPETIAKQHGLAEITDPMIVGALAHRVHSYTAASGYSELHPDQIIGCTLRHFFPDWFLIRLELEAVAKNIIRALSGERLDSRLRSALLHPEVLKEITKTLRAGPKELDILAQSLESAARERDRSVIELGVMSWVARQQPTEVRKAARGHKEALRETVSKLHASDEPTYQVDIRPSQAMNWGHAVRLFFERHVHYLGPLRVKPQPLYPLQAHQSPWDVGKEGENTAAVLHFNRMRTIKYIPASELDRESLSPEHLASAAVKATLPEAVVDWVNYMRLGSDVRTRDRGKGGYEIQIRTPETGRYHDLTNVGVGVSQVLPILVMALLAEPGSLLILEQPELHLHPSVQARLADFLLSVVVLRKQCLIESHGEYLVERLRRRVAEAEDDELLPLSRIYFVEKTDGESRCRPVELTKYGAIPEWPADFFDQSQIEREKILLAASLKRSREKRERQRGRGQR